MNIFEEYASQVLFLFICLVGIAFLSLLFVRVRAWRRNRAMRKTEAILLDALDEYARGKRQSVMITYASILRKNLFKKSGIVLINRVLNRIDAQQCMSLADLLKLIGFDAYLIEQLDTTDEEYLTLVVRTIGALHISHADSVIADKLIEYKNNLDLQYLGLLALSLNGDIRQMRRLTETPSYSSQLSFRSLMEIAGEYAGEKTELCRIACESVNSFARRLGIKLVAQECLYEFGPYLSNMMREETATLDERIDIIRALGQIRYYDALPEIKSATSDEDWRVRNVAFVALWRLEGEDCTETLLKGITDENWWVRTNTAKLLAQHTQSSQIADRLVEMQDSYAYQAFAYAMRKRELELNRR